MWSDCINHPGKPNNVGYVMRRKASGGWATSVHRIAWENARGPIPKGLHVLHQCDNRRCVNVEHLWLGTAADNARDRERKNRTRGLRQYASLPRVSA
jgi:hypothetical protein